MILCSSIRGRVTMINKFNSPECAVADSGGGHGEHGHMPPCQFPRHIFHSHQRITHNKNMLKISLMNLKN